MVNQMKKIFLVSILLILIIACGYSLKRHPTDKSLNFKVVKIPANAKLSRASNAESMARMSYPANLTQVQSSSDAIVLGRPTEDFLNRQHAYYPLPQDPDDVDSTEYVSSEWAEGDFVIEQVLWQRSDHTLVAGQHLPIVEPVGVVVSGSQVFRSVLEDCYEMKRDSRYVLFIGRGTDGTYAIDHHNLGRYNTDGTDSDDEVDAIGGLWENGDKTDKQKLRDELTATYGVTFVSPPPPPAPFAITTLSPDNALAGSAGLTLTVNGGGFQSGAFVTFDNRKTTQFVSSGRVSIALAAADVATARTVAVTVTNPGGQVSASKPFTVRANPSSPHPRIVRAENIRSTPPLDNQRVLAPTIIVSIGAPRAAGTSLSVELQKAGSATWAVVGSPVTLTQTSATANEEIRVAVNGGAYAGDSVRVRLLNSPVSSQYSNVFVLPATP